jgi:hypothetical protein
MTQFAVTFNNGVKLTKQKMLNGLSYEKAKEELQPTIDEANRIGRGIAKKYGKRHNNISFISLMR